MQQFNLTRQDNYAASIPEVIRLYREPGHFFPVNFHWRLIFGTALQNSFTTVMASNFLNGIGSETSASITSIIMQYAEDLEVKIIQRGFAPLQHHVQELNGGVVTFWRHGPFWCWIQASFLEVFQILDQIEEWTPNFEAVPDIVNTLRKVEILKHTITNGNARLWEFNSDSITIEGNTTYQLNFPNYWIAFDDLLHNHF